LVQDLGGALFQTAGILSYVEYLKQGTNTDIGPQDFFEMASKQTGLVSQPVQAKELQT